MANKSTYAGKIKNTGTQKVDALFKTEQKSKGKVIKGRDLRVGRSK